MARELPKVEGYAIRTGFYFHDEATGRQMPFLACSEEQNSGGWWVTEEELSKGTVECPHKSFRSGDDGHPERIPHRRHQVVTFEEALWLGIVDVEEGLISFAWEEVLDFTREGRARGALERGLPAAAEASA